MHTIATPMTLCQAICTSNYEPPDHPSHQTRALHRKSSTHKRVETMLHFHAPTSLAHLPHYSVASHNFPKTPTNAS
ncbi:hypothetical protein CC78DRAFT_530590 [Lojkania enalia]|uniref:Uncharacterized protein n=1 Tax=Lojkania enalia TaxID=147567 RepID=A0A9P4KEQ9_9PLEO|nr:hypothetical protein CC78DRAFT_530590 [Didymosphaeria enalia]